MTYADALKRAPFWVHVILVAVVLAAGATFVRPFSAVVSDEGAAIVQARQLETNGQWIIAEPPVTWNPQGTDGAYNGSDAGHKGRAFYARHPLYPEILRVVDEAAGTKGLVALSAFGTIVAGLMAAWLSQLVFGKYAKTTLWMTTVASPLWFYSFVILAHTLVAAAVGMTVAFAVVILKTKRWYLMPLVVAGSTLSAMLRSEGLFVGPAVVGAAALVMLIGPKRNLRSRLLQIATGGAALLGTVIAYLVERAWTLSILGTARNVSANDPEHIGFLAGRANGVFSTVFNANTFYSFPESVLLLVAEILVAVAAILIGRRSLRTSRSLWGLAIIFMIAALCVPSRAAVSGWAAAFPAGWFGLLLVRRQMFATNAHRFLYALAVLAVLAIFATEYSGGGGYQWGGRYLAFATAAMTPVLVASIYQSQANDVWIKRSVVTASVVMAIFSLVVVRQDHTSSEHLRLFAQKYLSDTQTTLDLPTETPVVWTQPLFLQVVWSHPNTTTWLAPNDLNVRRVLNNLQIAGVQQAVLVSANPAQTRAQIPTYFQVTRQITQPGVGVALIVVQHNN